MSSTSQIYVASHKKYGQHQGYISNILLEKWPSKKEGNVFFWKDRIAMPSLVRDMKNEGWEIIKDK